VTTRADRRQNLGWAPQALRREEAAAHCGVSPSKFDDWVARGILPKPKRVDGVVIWIRDWLDAALKAFPDEDQASPYDEVAA